MAATIYPVTPSFVAEVGDADLSKPLSEPDLNAVENAFWKYSVLIFPDQDLTPEQHLAFSEYFGPVEVDRVLDPQVTPHRLGVVRDMHRTTVSDIANTFEQAGVAVPA